MAAREDEKCDVLQDKVHVESIDANANDALEVYLAYSPEVAREIERKLVRKIDLHIMPFVVAMYLFNFLDRNSITQARLYGFQKDTHVEGTVYNTAIAIFSVGYILMQLPAAIMISKMRPHIFLPSVIILWATVSACTAASKNAAGLLSVRVFLGIVEAPFFPSALFFLSCWYTKKELGLRMALLVSALLLSNSFAGLISAGILSGMNNVGSLHAWQWLFILEGLATALLGVLAYFFLPDYPGTTKWLTYEERVVAQGRLAVDAGSDELVSEDNAGDSIWLGLRWAASDYRVWLFAFLALSSAGSMAFAYFLPTLIKDLGFRSNTLVLLLTSPPYMFAFFWAIGMGFAADRFQKRSPYALFFSITAIAGTICQVALGEQQWARYAMNFLVCTGVFGLYTISYAWLSSTIAKPRIKRAVAIGISNTMANVSTLAGNYFFLDKFAPYYRQSWACILGLLSLGLLCILALRFSLQRANKRFDRLAAETDINDPIAMARLTEEEDRAVRNGFRYVT